MKLLHLKCLLYRLIQTFQIIIILNLDRPIIKKLLDMRVISNQSIQFDTHIFSNEFSLSFISNEQIHKLNAQYPKRMNKSID